MTVCDLLEYLARASQLLNVLLLLGHAENCGEQMIWKVQNSMRVIFLQFRTFNRKESGGAARWGILAIGSSRSLHSDVTDDPRGCERISDESMAFLISKESTNSSTRYELGPDHHFSASL